MTINIEFLLARHPLLFFGWEGRVKGFDSGGVLAAVGGGGRNIHPLSAVKRARFIDVPKRLAGKLFNFSIIFFCF